MTPDGIPRDAWDQVAGLAAEIANAVCRDDDRTAAKQTARLLGLLDSLEKEYGERPSILATRADYTEDTGTRVRFLLRAFELAKQRHDQVNQTLAASSIAEIYIEELRNPVEGAYWLGVLEACVTQSGDESDRPTVERLKKELVISFICGL